MQIKKAISFSFMALNLLVLVFLVNTFNNPDFTNFTKKSRPLILPAKDESSNSVRVSEVIDGDTIRTDDGVTVRYIGVDSPEIGEQNECGALEARERNKQLVAGRDVILEKDISDKDKYGRLLRDVYVEHGGKLIMVNHELVVGGFARSYPVSPDVRYKGLLLEAENKAKEGGLGLWGLCGGI